MTVVRVLREPAKVAAATRARVERVIRETGYTPENTPLAVGDTLAFAPNGGRSCDGAFPYFRLAFAGGGMTVRRFVPPREKTRNIGARDSSNLLVFGNFRPK